MATNCPQGGVLGGKRGKAEWPVLLAAQQIGGGWGLVSPLVFETTQIPLLSGRPIQDTDRRDSPMVALISESLARRISPDGSALGVRVVLRDTLTVIGIVGDVKHESLEAEEHPTIYQPLAQRPISRVSLLVRAGTHRQDLFSSIRGAVWSIDPSAPISRVAAVPSLVRHTVREQEFRTTLMAIFAICACLLAGAGVFGVTARSVTRQLREMAIRKALGAQDNWIMRDALGHALRNGVAGIALGLAGVLWITRLLGQFLFNVESWDPLTYGTVTIVLLALTVLAAYLPARRAARSSLLECLRPE